MFKEQRKLFTTVLANFLFSALVAASAFSHTIDYIATDIQPEAEFLGQSGHFKLKYPLTPGGTIQFMLTLELIESSGGSTAELPMTVTFAVKETGGTDKPIVKFDSTGKDVTTYTYVKQNSRITPFTTSVTATAPFTPGSYHFKIQATDGFKGKGLQPGEGIVVHFKVAYVDVCDPAVTEVKLVVDPQCVIYRAPSTSLTATLLSSGTPLPGKPIVFSVSGTVFEATAVTDIYGKANLIFDPSDLAVGDHTVVARYQTEEGEECIYQSDSDSTTLGVTYNFLGFQPPVQISGVGAGLFSGKVIPVKIKIADFYGARVEDAEPRVYFSQTVQELWTEALAIQPEIADSGNLMRYDLVADQYIFNWDISGVQNGSYNIRVGMDEGEKCSVAHWAPVKIQKGGKR